MSSTAGFETPSPAKATTTSLSDLAAFASSGLALIISIASAYYSYKFHIDSTSAQMISDTYATFYEINTRQIENTDVGHIFVPEHEYAATAALVRLAVADAPQEELARYRLKEKAMADYMFTIFEQTLFQYELARSVGDTKRAAFLKTILDHFTGRVLRNARLLHYWSPSGGNLAQSFETTTRTYYERWVLKDPENPLSVSPDPVGPYRN